MYVRLRTRFTWTGAKLGRERVARRSGQEIEEQRATLIEKCHELLWDLEAAAREESMSQELPKSTCVCTRSCCGITWL
jgi:hypothetical protein